MLGLSFKLMVSSAEKKSASPVFSASYSTMKFLVFHIDFFFSLLCREKKSKFVCFSGAHLLLILHIGVTRTKTNESSDWFFFLLNSHNDFLISLCLAIFVLLICLVHLAIGRLFFFFLSLFLSHFHLFLFTQQRRLLSFVWCVLLILFLLFAAQSSTLMILKRAHNGLDLRRREKERWRVNIALNKKTATEYTMVQVQ